MWRLQKASESAPGIRIRPEPRILPLLKSGRVEEACRIAYRRLVVSGFTPFPGPTSSGIWREDEWELDSQIDPARLAASLLIPINNKAIHELIHLITRPHDNEEGEKEL